MLLVWPDVETYNLPYLLLQLWPLEPHIRSVGPNLIVLPRASCSHMLRKGDVSAHLTVKEHGGYMKGW
eukprot:557825-Amphidinium_carterae.1